MHIHPTFPVPQVGWWVFHIPGGGPHTRFPLALAGQPPFDYRPRHDLAPDPRTDVAQPQPPDARSPEAPSAVDPRRVVVFGAGGPVAAATTDELAGDHLLRLTDIRPLAEIVADGKRQKPGAPAPRLLAAPHESRVVDVADPDQVRDAVAGMDAIVNFSVVRHDPVGAFRVNTLGPYNLITAAVAVGVRRIVQTGPQHVTLTGPAGYWDDFGLAEDLPGRPGALLYTLSKYLGHEICRIFAEEHGLQIPLLFFSEFEDPAVPPEEPFGAFPFTVSWHDAAVAVRRALHAPPFPRPCEPFHITADLPHGKYSNAKAKALLGWQPRDRLEAHWRRPDWPT
jgi:nucleoside-diphosphate-sugar epimerase